MILATLTLAATLVCPATKFVGFPEGADTKALEPLVNEGCERNYPTSPCATKVERLPSGHVNVTCSEKK